MPTKLTLDSAPALEAFQWFVDLQNKYHVVPNKVDEATQADQSRFEHGTLGMYLNSRVETPELRETIEDKPDSQHSARAGGDDVARSRTLR